VVELDDAEDEAMADDKGAAERPRSVGNMSVGSAGNTRKGNWAPGKVSTERTTPVRVKIEYDPNKFED